MAPASSTLSSMIPTNKFILSSRVLFEMSQGSSDVFQGNGSGNVTPSLHFLKGFDKLQLVGGAGITIPFDSGEESTVMFDTWNASYAVTPWFFPLVELNHFRVINDGNEKGLVPEIVTFEGGDLINFGASPWRAQQGHRDPGPRQPFPRAAGCRLHKEHGHWRRLRVSADRQERKSYGRPLDV